MSERAKNLMGKRRTAQGENGKSLLLKIAKNDSKKVPIQNPLSQDV